VGVKQNAETFNHHVDELRRRFFWVLLAVGISAILGYVFRDGIIKILQNPLGAPMFYSSPAGSFNFVMKISSIIGVFVALPVIIYQILRFIEPALPNRVKATTMARLIAASYVLAIMGIAFGFFIMIPQSLHFFSGYSTDQIKPLISANEYLNFVLNTLIFFALAFQIPLFISFYNTIKPTKPRKLLKYQKHVIVGSLVLAIILPFTFDPISQFVLALPIVALFYFSVVLLWISDKRINRKIKLQAKRARKHAVANRPRPELDEAQPVIIPTPVYSAVQKPAIETKTVDGFVMPINSNQKLANLRQNELAEREARRQAAIEQLNAESKKIPKGSPAIDGVIKVLRTA
jgi:sec-independent protein translocase protein TatC